MSDRIYLTRSSLLDEALQAAPEAGLVEGGGTPTSRKAEAWALYGYRCWREEQEREQKLADYEAIGADDEHLEAIEAANKRAVEAGLL